MSSIVLSEKENLSIEKAPLLQQTEVDDTSYFMPLKEVENVFISPLKWQKEGQERAGKRFMRKRKKICHDIETKSIRIEEGFENSGSSPRASLRIVNKEDICKKRHRSCGRDIQIQNLTSKELSSVCTFVKQLMSVPGIQRHQDQFPENSLILQTHRFFEHRKQFRSQEKSTNVTVVFHYTTKEHLHRWFTPSECLPGDTEYETQRITCTVNPYHLTSKGDIGLIMAVLKGTISRVGKKDMTNIHSLPIDTAIRNRELYDCTKVDLQPLYHDEMIFQAPTQCLPLFQFPTRSMLQCSEFALGFVLKYQQDLQALMDKFFNNGCSSQLESPVLEDEIAPISGDIIH